MQGAEQTIDCVFQEAGGQGQEQEKEQEPVQGLGAGGKEEEPSGVLMVVRRGGE